jgi:hypothetical protein
MKVLREGLLKLSISREIMPLLDLKGRALWGLQPWPLGTLAGLTLLDHSRLLLRPKPAESLSRGMMP